MSQETHKLPTMLTEGGDGDNCNDDNLLGCDLNANGSSDAQTSGVSINSRSPLTGTSGSNSLDSCDTNDDDDRNYETASSSDEASGSFNNEERASLVDMVKGAPEDKWRPINETFQWIQRQISLGTDPMDVLRVVFPQAIDHLPPRPDKIILWKTILDLFSEPPRRKKLPHVNTLDDVVDLIRKCKNIIVLTGAGVSVSCGIPDFRSSDGIYARLKKSFPDLPDPQAMFDIMYFCQDPRPFFKFAKEIYPGQFTPSVAHKFIKLIEDQSKLLRNYTQNIDTLEKVAKIEKVITCHGSFATATCTRCGYKTTSDAIKADIFAQRIPLCPECTDCPEDTDTLPVIKPDIVFFGEKLSDEFHDSMALDKDKCDLLIVMGSSLKVRPVASIPDAIPPEVPRILINRESLDHICFDVELLGDCDDIVQKICRKLGGVWSNLCQDQTTSDKSEDISSDDTNNRDIDSSESNSSDTFKSSSPISPVAAPLKEEETTASMLTIPDTSSSNYDDSMGPGTSHVSPSPSSSSSPSY